MRISKGKYLQTFAVISVILALYRCAFPGVAQPVGSDESADSVITDSVPTGMAPATIPDTITTRDIVGQPSASAPSVSPLGRPHRVAEVTVPHPIYSVPRFKDCFPDSQEVHLSAAQRYGVRPVADRSDAERRKSELVYIGANPFFHVESLRNSVPYLVPRASILVQDIGRSFFDSLYVKGIPLHKIIVTSALRTRADVERLRQRNGNATENSCHLYGTTIDISQNRYLTVAPPGQHRRSVSNDTLKWILSEVLRDYRESGRCYIKYEVKQGCFHVTVR